MSVDDIIASRKAKLREQAQKSLPATGEKSHIESALSSIGAAMEGASNTASFGLLDDASAMSDALFSKIGGSAHKFRGVADEDLAGKSIMERYEVISDATQVQQDQMREEHPYASLTGDVAGAMLGAPAKIGAATLRSLAPKGFLTKAASAAAIGAGEGGVMSLMSGKRGGEALTDTASGAVGGPLGFGLGAAAGNVWNTVTGTKTARALKDALSRRSLRGAEAETLMNPQGRFYIEETPQTLEAAKEAVGKFDLTDPKENDRFLKLQDATRDDLAESQRALHSTADMIKPNATAGQRQAKLRTDLEVAHGEYDGMMAGYGKETLDGAELIRNVNYAFQPRGTTTVLSDTAEGVRDTWTTALEGAASRSPNGQIPLETLLDVRKDMSNMLSSPNAVDLKSAFPKLTVALKSIDNMIDAKTNGNFKHVNKLYSDSYQSAEAFETGIQQSGNKYDADHVIDWLTENPALRKEYIDGMSYAAHNKLDSGLMQGLRYLFGAVDDPLKVNNARFKKLEAIMPNEARAMRDIYQTHGPRVQTLKSFHDALTTKGNNPEASMSASVAPEINTTVHTAIADGPLAVNRSIGSARAAHKALVPDQNAAQYSPRETSSLLDLLNARGSDYHKRLRKVMKTKDAKNLTPQLTAAGAVATGQDSTLPMLMGGYGNLMTMLDDYAAKQKKE